LSLPVDVKFRLEAAAKVLERAAKRTNDRQLRSWLVEEANRLRKIAEGDMLELSDFEDKVRIRTLDEVVEEVRRFIWEGVKTKPSEEKPKERKERDPLAELESRINNIIDEFEKRLKIIDELFKVMP